MFIQKNQTMKNDWYFNLYTSNESISETEKKIIEIIDHAKVTPEKRIETKYGLGTLRNLSSGCKTLLNVMKNPDKIVSEITTVINEEPLAKIDYIKIVDADTISAVSEINGNILVAAAVYIGKTRLIDNFITGEN